METKQCEICGKVIEGYKTTHVDYLMKQHMLTHPYSEDIEIISKLNKGGNQKCYKNSTTGFSKEDQNLYTAKKEEPGCSSLFEVLNKKANKHSKTSQTKQPEKEK